MADPKLTPALSRSPLTIAKPLEPAPVASPPATAAPPPALTEKQKRAAGLADGLSTTVVAHTPPPAVGASPDAPVFRAGSVESMAAIRSAAPSPPKSGVTTGIKLDRENRATLQSGQRHIDVFLLRGALGLAVKGTGGYLSSDVVSALKAFQKQNPPLKVTGQADAATWEKLKTTRPEAFTPAKFEEAEAVLNQVKTDSTGAPVFEQSDPRWSQLKVGLSESKSMSQVGCGVSSLAAAISRLGDKKLVTPDALNAVLRDAGAFASGANLNFKAASDAIFAKYGIQLGLNGSTSLLLSQNDGVPSLAAGSGKTITAAIDGQLAAGLPAVLRVDNSADGVATSDHFVLVTRKEGDRYLVLDPGVGQEQPYTLKDGTFQAVNAYYPQKMVDGARPPNMAPIAVGFVPSTNTTTTKPTP